LDKIDVESRKFTTVIIDTGGKLDLNSIYAQNVVAAECFNDCNNGTDRQSDKDGVTDYLGHGHKMASIFHLGNPQGNIIIIKSVANNGQTKASINIAANEWIIENKVKYNIGIVNLSFGGGAYEGYCDYDADPAVFSVYQKMQDLNIHVIAAAGNKGKKGYVALPACFSPNFAVAPVYSASAKESYSFNSCDDTDINEGELPCFANFNKNVSLLSSPVELFGTGGSSHISALQSAIQSHFYNYIPDENVLEILLKWTGIYYKFIPENPTMVPGHNFEKSLEGLVKAANSYKEDDEYALNYPLSSEINDEKLTLEWDAVDKADGYILYYAMMEDPNKYLPIDMGNTTELLVDLPKGFACYVKIEPYFYNFNGEQVKGVVSNTRKVIVKN